MSRAMSKYFTEPVLWSARVGEAPYRVRVLGMDLGRPSWGIK